MVAEHAELPVEAVWRDRVAGECATAVESAVLDLGCGEFEAAAPGGFRVACYATGAGLDVEFCARARRVKVVEWTPGADGPEAVEFVYKKTRGLPRVLVAHLHRVVSALGVTPRGASRLRAGSPART